MTRRQKQEIIYTLARRRELGRQLRNDAAAIIRHCDAQIAAILALPEKKRRADGTRRQGSETDVGCLISKMKVPPQGEERKRGQARRDDIENRVRSLARQFLVTPELEGGRDECRVEVS